MIFELGIQYQELGPRFNPNFFLWENAWILDFIETIKVFELKIVTTVE